MFVTAFLGKSHRSLSLGFSLILLGFPAEPYLLFAAWPLSSKSAPYASQEEEEMFRAASQMYQETTRDKIAAIEAYERFLKRFPSSPRAADAEFMVGEAYFEHALAILKEEESAKKTSPERLLAPRNAAALEALRSAREAFQTVVDKYAKSGLAASAQYRLGEVAYNRKAWPEAVEEFRRIEKDFSKTYIVPESWIGIVYADLALEQFSQAEANLFLLGETYPHYLKEPAVLYAQGIVQLKKGNYAAAEEHLSRVKIPEAVYYLGKSYLLSNRPYLAASTFEKMGETYPQAELKAEADFFIADAFFLAKDYEGALAKYERFLIRHPDSHLKVAAEYRIGAAFFKKGDHVKARAQFDELLKKYPKDFFAPLAQYFIGESHLEQARASERQGGAVGFLPPFVAAPSVATDHVREALFAYTKVITQFPETVRVSSQAHYKLAWTQHQVGDFNQAAQTCANFLTLYPQDALAKNVYLVLGNALKAMKKQSEAVTAFQRVLDLAPGSEIAEQALFSILQSQLELKNYYSILTSYQFIFRHLPPSQSKWRSLSFLYAAEAYLALNQVDQALDIYDMILKVYPDDLAAYYSLDGLAWSHTFKGDDDKALEYRRRLKELVARESSKVTASSFGINELGIADSLYNQKLYNDAYELYEKFAKENPLHPGAATALHKAATSLYHLKYFSQAVETWRKLERDYPKSKEAPQAAYQVGDVLFRGGKYAEASAAYQRILETYSDSPQLPFAYLRIAYCGFNAKNDVKTLEDAKRLLLKFPASSEATDALDLMEAVFDRSPQLDFREILRSIASMSPDRKVQGATLFRLGRRLFEKKDYAGAASEFQRFSVEHTAHADLGRAQFYLGEALFLQGKSELASQAYERFLANFPKGEETALALFHLAGSHYNLKNYEAAAKSYEDLLKDYPDSTYVKAARFNLALSYRSLGKTELAEEAYAGYAQHAGAADKAGLDALWQVFYLKRERRDHEGALQVLQDIRRAPQAGADALVEAGYREGETYTTLGRTEEAAAAYEKVRAMKPAASPFRLQSLIRLGEYYERVSDPGRAIVVYDDLGRSATDPQLARSAQGRAAALRKSGAQPKTAPSPQPPPGAPPPGTPKKGGALKPKSKTPDKTKKDKMQLPGMDGGLDDLMNELKPPSEGVN